MSRFYKTRSPTRRIWCCVSAQTTTHARCTFTVQNWNEQSFSDVGGELKLTHATVAKQCHGDLEGESTLQYLMYYGPHEQTRVLGIERVSGKLGGKSGTFVLEQIGADDGSEARTRVTVLPGSGTGELRGLQGTGEMVATREGSFTMTLDYELPN
jgi:hypothetical protein